MVTKIFTLKFDPVIEKFDDVQYQEFVKDKEIIDVNEHFFENSYSHYLVLVVKCKQAEYKQLTQITSGTEKKRDEEWKALIKKEEYPLFNTLREWRNSLASKEGKPPYIISTNVQLAEIIKQKPETLSSLISIRGFGEEKVKKYGNELLSILSKESKKVHKKNTVQNLHEQKTLIDNEDLNIAETKQKSGVL